VSVCWWRCVVAAAVVGGCGVGDAAVGVAVAVVVWR